MPGTHFTGGGAAKFFEKTADPGSTSISGETTIKTFNPDGAFDPNVSVDLPGTSGSSGQIEPLLRVEADDGTTVDMRNKDSRRATLNRENVDMSSLDGKNAVKLTAIADNTGSDETVDPGDWTVRAEEA